MKKIEELYIKKPYQTGKLLIDRLIEGAENLVLTDELKSVLESHAQYTNFDPPSNAFEKKLIEAILINGESVNEICHDYKISTPFIVGVIPAIYALAFMDKDQYPPWVFDGEVCILFLSFIGRQGSISFQYHKLTGTMTLDVSFSFDIHKPARILKLH